MTGKRTPQDALLAAIQRAVWHPRKYQGPGQLIAAMSKEDRELLKQLTSKDALNMREDAPIPDEPPFGTPTWKEKGWQWTLKAILEGRLR